MPPDPEEATRRGGRAPRSWVSTGLATCLLMVAGGGGDGSPSADPDVAECRDQWVDLAQLHSENGNPGGPVPALVTRWDEVAAEAARLAHQAGPDDCGTKIAESADAWADIESFQYDLAELDPATDLFYAEIDRRHAEDLYGPLCCEVERAFRIIRRETPPAIVDLEPALAGAADLDLEDGAAVEAFLREARRIKGESVHIQRMAGPAA